eukprot:2280833-Pleurochrysis_carterae.AAC.2
MAIKKQSTRTHHGNSFWWLVVSSGRPSRHKQQETITTGAKYAHHCSNGIAFSRLTQVANGDRQNARMQEICSIA